MENYSAIQEHINQLTRVQTLIAKHNLKQTQARNKIINYLPPKIYFQLRNCAEKMNSERKRFISYQNKQKATIGNN